MEPTYLIDYLRLAFRLGHMSASLGEFTNDHAANVEDWQDDIDALADRMTELNLPQSKLLIISFLEQVGDITQNPDLVNVLTDEAEANLQEVIHSIHREADELRAHPETLPGSIRDLLPPRLFDILPDRAQQEYEEAKKNLMAGTWTSAVRSTCVAVEATLGALYTLVTGQSSQGKLWNDMQEALKTQGTLNGKPMVYFTDLLRDIQKNYRNPTVHGQLRFEDDYEALLAFYHCAEALRRMGEAMLTKTMPGS